MLKSTSFQETLIDIKRSNGAITVLVPIVDTDELAERLFDTIQTMTASPTVIGSDDWKAKLAALAYYFGLIRCDAEGNLIKTNALDELLLSFLRDSVPPAG